jgi:hypothetical protein
MPLITALAESAMAARSASLRAGWPLLQALVKQNRMTKGTAWKYFFILPALLLDEKY